MTRSAWAPGEWHPYQASLAGIPDQTEAEKLQAKATRPLRSSKPQRAADFGLFDTGSRAQLDLVDYASQGRAEPAEHVSQHTQPKED